LIYLFIELIEVVSEKKTPKYSLFKSLPCHDLPLTNCAFNKNGDKFITGSYDQTCIIWDTETGNVVHRLKGHKNVVYAISFNLPYGDKVATGSFDSTAKVKIIF
jgi:dynein assembly factor with WDR repeat domains 1